MTTLSFPVADLRQIVKVVAPAAGTDEARPILTGVLVEIDTDGVLSFVATDSYRLHRVSLVGIVDTPIRVNIPAGWLMRWADTPFGRRSTVTLSVDDGRVELGTETNRDSTAIITGSVPYPDYKKFINDVVPDEGASSFNPEYLAGVFTAAAEWGDDRSHPLNVTTLNALKPCMFNVRNSLGVLDMLLMPVRLAP